MLSARSTYLLALLASVFLGAIVYYTVPALEQKRLEREKEMVKHNIKVARVYGAFKEISVPFDERSPVEIILPGGVRVCLVNNGSQEDFVKLIRGVAGC